MPNWRRLLRECPHTTIDASEHPRRAAGRADGQLGGRPPEHRCRARRLPGLHAHRARRSQLARSRTTRCWSMRSKPRAQRRRDAPCARPGVAGRRAQPRGADRGADRRSPARTRCRRCAVHAFLDGRDTPPRSAAARSPCGSRPAKARERAATDARIASICGRYFAMDRDKRWERIAPRMRCSSTDRRRSPRRAPPRALEAAYARGETDEFVQADGGRRQPRSTPAQMRDGDVVVFMNFRADRARQLTRALTDPDVRRLRARPRARSSRVTSR